MYRKLLLFFFGFLYWTTIHAQGTVTGAVTDPQGEPVVGATVTMKGAAGGAVTDTLGRFTLQLPEGMNTLLVRYTGYAPLEIKVEPGQPINIRLRQEGIRLPETVITALNIPRESKSLGYATQQLEGKAVSEVRETNFVNSLSGKLAGVQVITSSGNLGSSSRLVIRGIRSLTGENQPLFVVDGVPMDNSNFNSQLQIEGIRGVDYGNTIQDLNPNDIESIDVLKGAAAAALYGSRAANGVIVITTKRMGFNAPLEVNFSSQSTFESVAILPKFQNEYGGGDGPFQMENGEPVVNFGTDLSWGPKFDPNLLVRQWYSYFPEFPEYYGKATPWVAHPNNIRDFFKTGVSLNNSISIGGGGRAMNARLSYANLRQTGTYPNSLLDRHQVGLNAGLRLVDWLAITASINYTTHQTHGRASSGNSSGGGGYSGPVTASLLSRHQRQIDMNILRRYYKVSDIQQVTWNRYGSSDPRPAQWDNPYWQANENAPEDGRGRTFGNLTAVFQCAPGLTFTTRMSLDNYTDQREEKSAKVNFYDGVYSIATYVVSERNADFLLNYRKNFRPDFSLYAMLGGNFRKNSSDIISAYTSGGLTYAGVYNLANSKNTPIVSAFKSESVVNGVFGTANLGYKSMIYLELTGRNDWASTLPPGNNSTFYPSASLVLCSANWADWLRVPGCLSAKSGSTGRKWGSTYPPMP